MTRIPKLLGHGRDDRGQALVEFALVMPMLLLLVLGIIEFGRAWNAQEALTDAAREGARVAVVSLPDPTTQSVKDAVKQGLTNARLDPSKADIDVENLNGGTGQPTTVYVRYPYTFAYVGVLAGWATGQSSITLGTQVTMRDEG